MHVHTPGSYHWNGGKIFAEMDEDEKEESIKQFIRTVNSLEIEVFTIQDYWNFDFYLALRKYTHDNPNELKKAVFPGMELRIESSSDFRLNIHVILADDLTNQKLQEFKNKLQIGAVAGSPRSLSDEALIDLAKTYDSAKASKHGFADPASLSDLELLKLGSATAEITRQSIRDAIDSLPDGKGFIMLAYDTSDGLEGINWEEHPQDDNAFMQTSHLFEARSQENIDLFNAVKTDANEKFFENFYITLGRKAKPAIAGSDAHKFADYGKYPSNRATWIKADPTFRGFEQIIYEPRGRARVQQLIPEEKSAQLIIDRVEYKNPNGILETVYLNQNLNSLIGSRAQGKSNLLKNIAYAIDPEQLKVRNIDTSDFLPLKEFKVYWSDGSTNTLDPNEEKGKGILFIPQKFLGELLYGKVPKFDSFLTDLFENFEDFSKSLEAYKKAANQNSISIATMLGEVLEIQGKGSELSAKLKKLGNRDSFLKEVSEIEDRLKALGVEAQISEQDLQNYDSYSENLKLVQKQIENAKRDVASLNELKDQDVITTEQIDEFGFTPETFQKIQAQLDQTDKEFKTEFIKSEVVSLGEQIEKYEVTQRGYLEKIKPLQDRIKKHDSLVGLTKKQGELRTTIATIDEITGELSDLRKSFIAKRQELANLNSNFLTEYDHLNVSLPELKFTDVKIVISFDSQSLLYWQEQYINYHNSLDFKRDKGTYDEANIYLNSPSEWDYDSKKLGHLIFELIHGILAGKLVLKTGANIRSTIQELLKNRFKIDFLKSVKNKDGVIFTEMSDGEQMLALLEMIFRLDDYDYPVLLDQPEDDLDSRAISTTVVEFLVTEKTTRQIIIASHNANLVVCGDSENILVSQKTGGKKPSFKYLTGSIENEKINAEILNILEGGEDAFELRRKKIGKRS